VRGEPDVVPGRAGRRRRQHRPPAHARGPAHRPAPARPGVPRLETGSRNRRPLPPRARSRLILLFLTRITRITADQHGSRNGGSAWLYARRAPLPFDPLLSVFIRVIRVSAFALQASRGWLRTSQ